MHFVCVGGGQKRGISSKYVKMIFLCLKRFSGNILSLYYFDLIFFKSLFDAMFKRWQKETKKIF